MLRASFDPFFKKKKQTNKKTDICSLDRVGKYFIAQSMPKKKVHNRGPVVVGGSVCGAGGCN